MGLTIKKECYEYPRRVLFRLVLDQWLAPDHRYFKVEGDNGSIYIVRHDMTSLQWELTLFEEKQV